MNLNFLDQFRKTLIKFHENPSPLSCCMRKNGQTDLTKPTVTFRNFANALKNGFKY